MLEREEAQKRVSEHITERDANTRPGFELIIDEDATIETNYGWIFYYQTRLFIETKKALYSRTGCYPILVDKVSGELIPVNFTKKKLDDWLKKHEIERGRRSEEIKYDRLLFFLNAYLSKDKSGSFENERSAVNYYLVYANLDDKNRIISQARNQLK